MSRVQGCSEDSGSAPCFSRSLLCSAKDVLEQWSKSFTFLMMKRRRQIKGSKRGDGAQGLGSGAHSAWKATAALPLTGFSRTELTPWPGRASKIPRHCSDASAAVSQGLILTSVSEYTTDSAKPGVPCWFEVPLSTPTFHSVAEEP